MPKTPRIVLVITVLAMWLILSWYTESLNPGESAARLAADLAEWANEMRLTSATLTDNGVAETPQELAGQAASTLGSPVTIEEYTLARMLACESTPERKGGNDEEKQAIVWVALNDANANNAGDIVACVTGGHGYGHQGSLRKYATALQDPTGHHLEVVRDCMTGRVPDPTSGATHFMRRRAFDTHAAYLAVVDTWTKRGWQNIGLDFGTSLEIWTA
jgi:hypothetical protein